MSLVCPACGVAVVSGYAKCPKCHAALPVRKAGPAKVAGGTVSDDKPFPFVPLGAAVGGLVLFIIVGKLACGGSSESAPPDAQTVAQPQQPVVQPTQPQAPADRPFGGRTTPAQPQAPDPSAAASELERALRGKRLWSTIETVGSRVDVRSTACEDPQMVPTVSGLAPVLRDGGLTRVRCLAQSGTVVFERDL